MNPEPPLPLPVEIPRQLRAFARARRRWAAARALGESGLALGVGLAGVAVIEGFARPGLSGRIALSATAEGLAGLWLLGRLGRAWFVRPTLPQLARDLEQAAGWAPEESIWSAVEMAGTAAPHPAPGISRWMLAQTVARAARQIAALNPSALLDRRPVWRVWRRTGAVAALLLLAALGGAAGRLRLAANPYASALALSRVQFVVTPGDCTVGEGTNLIVRLTTDRLPEAGKLTVAWADGSRESLPLNQTGTHAFQVELPGVGQSFHYQVLAAGAESPVFAAQVIAAPKLTRLSLTIQPPAYTGWTNQTIAGGSADFLAGSRLTLTATPVGSAVALAEMVPAEGAAVRLEPATNGVWQLALSPTNSLRYAVRLTGENRLVSGAGEADQTLTPTPDLPPTASLSALGAEFGLVQRDELLPLTIQAADDVGLRRVDLVLLGSSLQSTQRTLFTVPPGGAVRDFAAAPNLALADFPTQPGDELQFFVVATDLLGQTNASAPLGFTVAPPEKSAAARLAARLRTQVAALLAAGENLRGTRTAWLTAGRHWREQEAATRTDTSALILSRIAELGREVDRAGEALIGESRTNDVPEARFLYRLGTSLSAWAGGQGRVLARELGAATQAPAEAAPAQFARGDDLLALATADVTKFTHVVAVLQGALESDVLATRSQLAQARYQRVFPVLRGEAESLADALAPAGGLDATYYSGIELKGRVLDRQIQAPRLTNLAPGGRRENWSARYEGALNVPAAGDWTLACVADDGVRLLLDGDSLLPAAAWGAHAATEYRADRTLTAGWHPVVIEFYQGSSESKLEFLMARRGEPLVEVPAHRLRAKSAPEPAPVPPGARVVDAATRELLRTRLGAGLAVPAGVPSALAPVTNVVNLPKLTALVAAGAPAGAELTAQLPALPTWDTAAGRTAEGRADDLTALAGEARRLLREELERHRWEYEGSAALKPVQTALQELRTINEQLRRLPWNDHKHLAAAEQAQVELAKVWQAELARATTEAAHELFNEARRPEATLAERIGALQAAAQAADQLAPAVAKLAPVLAADRGKNSMGDEVDRRLNEINDRFRELNDAQERLNREAVAGQARAALPAARALARATPDAHTPADDPNYAAAHAAAERVAEAERVIGDYQNAAHLEALAGATPQTADAPALARELRNIANQTDRNPPSLAAAIPPPMQQAGAALAAGQTTPAAAADQLAKPRLALSLEAARLNRQGDRPAATAYELLGQDLGKVLNQPAGLDAPTLQPLTDRALALAGAKGDAARQAEIQAAQARAAQLAAEHPASPLALAKELDTLAAEAMDATRNAALEAPLHAGLEKMEGLAAPVRDWSDSAVPVEVAAGAAHDAAAGLAAAPKSWEAHQQASEILADAARQLRQNAALQDLAGHEPFPAPPADAAAEPTPGEPSLAETRTAHPEGAAGRALTQAPPRGVDQAEWARLNDRLRQGIRNSGAEHFTPEQRAAIQAYFEKLGSVK